MLVIVNRKVFHHCLLWVTCHAKLALHWLPLPKIDRHFAWNKHCLDTVLTTNLYPIDRKTVNIKVVVLIISFHNVQKVSSYAKYGYKYKFINPIDHRPHKVHIMWHFYKGIVHIALSSFSAIKPFVVSSKFKAPSNTYVVDVIT